MITRFDEYSLEISNYLHVIVLLFELCKHVWILSLRERFSRIAMAASASEETLEKWFELFFERMSSEFRLYGAQLQHHHVLKKQSNVPSCDATAMGSGETEIGGEKMSFFNWLKANADERWRAMGGPDMDFTNLRFCIQNDVSVLFDTMCGLMHKIASAKRRIQQLEFANIFISPNV